MKKKLIKQLTNRNPLLLQCDMTQEDDIRGMFKWIEEHSDLGKVDVCIPNAGYSADKSLLDGSMEEWKGMLDVNVLALNLCTQLAVKSMIKVFIGTSFLKNFIILYYKCREKLIRAREMFSYFNNYDGSIISII